MAPASFLFGSFLVLFSLLVNASADYGGNAPKPERGINPSDKPTNSEMLKTKALPISVQGTIFCKSGSTYTPIQGAVTRLTCLAMDENGYETAPFSVLSYTSDARGYFFATLFLSQIGESLTVTECKVFLENSPLDDCKVPTDVNNGVTGSLLSAYRLLVDKKMKLFSVGPFFYTSEEEPAPTNHGY